MDCSTDKHYVKQLARIISQKLNKYTDRPLADKPETDCVGPRGSKFQTGIEYLFALLQFNGLKLLSIKSRIAYYSGLKL